MTILNDKSPMPFGKHYRKEMANVPAGYLLWLFDQFKKQESLSRDARHVKEYIEENLEALKLEVKNEHSRLNSNDPGN